MSRVDQRKRLRILMISLNQKGQGTFRRAHALGRALGERGHMVDLMATSRSNRRRIQETKEPRLTLIETPDLFRGSLRSGWDLWNAFQRIRWARGKTFDVVHAFETRPTVLLPALYVQAKAEAKLVMDWADWFGRGGSVEQRPNPILRTILRPIETYFEERFRHRADGATVISETLRDKAQLLSKNDQPIMLLVNGSDTTRVQPLAQEQARLQLGFSLEYPFIGHMGAIFRDDAAFMAAAFDDVITRMPEARLLVAGYCPFDVRKWCRHPEAVIQTGYVAENLLNAHLAACDVLWLPLRSTNANRGRLPLKVNDYMSAGRPVVATDVGDWPKRIRQGKFGFVTPVDESAFASATVSLLADRTLMHQMGQQSRMIAETEYQWSELAKQLESFYLALLPQRQQSYDAQAANSSPES